MKTSNSLSASEIDILCCWSPHRSRIACPIRKKPEECTPYTCAFYKPDGARNWVRVDDEDGINFIPPEEYFPKAERSHRDRKTEVWRIKRVRVQEA